MKPLRVTLWATVAVAVGLAAEWASDGFREPERWVPDLLTGWVVVGCGLVAWYRRPNRQVGLLLTATGLLWFVGNFASLQVEALAWIAAHGVYLHRGPLVQVIVAYPLGVARSRLERVAVAVGYATAMVTPAWGNERSAIVLGLALIVVAAVLHARSVARVRRARLLTLWVASAVGGVIAGGAAARLVLFPSDVAENASLLGYQLVLCAAAVRARRQVSCLVRWSGPRSPTWWSSSARNARIGFVTCWPGRSATPPSRSATGRRRSAATSTRRAARCRSPPPVMAGRPRRSARRATRSAILIHHPSLLDDPGLSDSIATAARLASVNARLQAEVRAQIVELASSRRRIVTAGDEEHRRLECRLRDGRGTPARSTGRPASAGSGRNRRRSRHDVAAVGRRPSR